MPPGAVAHRASLPFTVCQSLLRLMSMESVMLTKHLILCRLPLLFVESQNSFLAWPLLTSAVLSVSNTNSCCDGSHRSRSQRCPWGRLHPNALSLGLRGILPLCPSTEHACCLDWPCLQVIHCLFSLGAGQSPLSPQLAGDCIHFYC